MARMRDLERPWTISNVMNWNIGQNRTNTTSSSSCCSRGWSRPLLAFGLIKSLPLNQIISRQWHHQKTEYRKLPQWRSILPLKLFNVGDSTTSSGRPFQMLTIRKPKKFALSFVLQHLFWIFKQCPLVSNVLSPISGSILDESTL